ncbi:hypothetical protein [Nonomuraea gerenzanensis]|uniref:hypothetical protein n=1 Tax=Nonomuraea gerenzanensis TaxID=93944 RepID=UPI001CDA1D46|nr:hypothetical protein [Nonomuraea gerenzanensis]UBU19231.1 hypothetical protein LCN96_56375 [Nonomuraea gerenzanensis]
MADYDKRRKAGEMARSGNVKPLRTVNFEPKRIRKAKRKALVRGYVANKVADVRTEMQDRAEFFRNLRIMKMQRRKIAAEMAFLADDLRALQREVASVERRHPTVDLKLVDETHDLVRDALKAASVAADEYFAFSRQRIYYIKELAA